MSVPIRGISPALSIGAVALGCAITVEGVWRVESAIAQIEVTPGGTNTQVIDPNPNDSINQLDINGGESSANGKNLFHGFDQFNVDSGQLVNFNTDSRVENVFSHIIGGASVVNGALQVSGSDANFYLINPAGILFGPDVQLMLPGSFTAATASNIGFVGNRQLDLANSELTDVNYRQLLQAPTYLDFADAGSIVTLGDLSVADGQTISLIGGSLLTNGTVEAPNGSTFVTTVEDGSRVRLSRTGQILSVEILGISNAFEPLSVSQLLTGSGLADASVLDIDQDGTVRLLNSGSDTDTEAPRVAMSGSLEIPAGRVSDVDIGDIGGEGEASFSDLVMQSFTSVTRLASEAAEASATGTQATGTHSPLSVATQTMPSTEAVISERLEQVEISTGTQFANYLNLQTEEISVATLSDMQETLRHINQKSSSVHPALLYAYFVPSAGIDSGSMVDPLAAPMPHPSDRLEIMLVTADGIPVKHLHVDVTRAAVAKKAAEFRREITSQFSRPADYLPPAQQLYKWLIQPLESQLDAQETNSLGFIMDDGLRILPLAALHDGEQFLVEQYSLGLIPAFSLTNFEIDEPKSMGKVLAMGVSEFQDQPPLPAVEAELSFISESLWLGDAFLNESFTLENLKAKIISKKYGIIHLATHAFFDAKDAGDSYIQLWEERLKLSDLRTLGLGSSNIAMVILSACNTALGDRASEYGFAGLALSAGSQSAMASLWPVSDEGTLGFITQFYGMLSDEGNQSASLRAAQMSLIRGDVGLDYGRVYGPDDKTLAVIPELSNSGSWDFSHPYYWSAFTMIGNPW